jgi:dipeptidyl aminopeptidase/acylaminoacyl peptidase
MTGDNGGRPDMMYRIQRSFNRRELRRAIPLVLALGFMLGVASPALTQVDSEAVYRTPAPELAALVDAPATPGVSLSPDESVLLLMTRPGAPSIAEVSAPELRLAGLRIDPRNNGPSRARTSIDLAFRDMDGNQTPVSGLPADPRIGSIQWSPDGSHIAFTHTMVDRVELWVASVETGVARRALDRPLNAAFRGAPFQWSSDGQSLVVRTVPRTRGAAPAEPSVPTGPVIQETSGEAAPARTYQDLLQNQHDEALFEYYTTVQVVRVGLDGVATEIGAPGMIQSMSPSPDGEYVLVEEIHRPFSYLVPASRFPTRIHVWDAEGNTVAELADVPLRDQVPSGFGSVPEGVRSIDWRADAPATLTWVEAQDGGDANAEAEIRDRMFMLQAPFIGEPTALASFPLRYGGAYWAEEGYAVVYESWFATRQMRAYVVDPDDPEAQRSLFDFSMESPYDNPGSPMTRSTDQGTEVLLTADGGETLFLVGQGASPEGNRPFLRSLDLATGETEELFRSEAPYYEMPVAIMGDGSELLTRRESNTEPPNFFVRDLDGGDGIAVTDFPHPYPELAGIQSETVQYNREDGVPLTATLYLPADYDSESDGPLPTFVWAYPQEFKSADAAGQRTDSPYQFKRVSAWGAVPWVTRGYAVLDDASMPVVGEGDEEPNDTFREQLVANAQAAIDEGVRRGVVDPDRVAIGGHSYGAFMTANLLAHSDLFRAGVARSGAYNRSLTPFGFQREERLFWEAPEVYFSMSPFMHADKVDEPILLIHGEADNNSGTFPIQSIRFYNAIKGLGGTARLVMLPDESHGYAARESLLHMLWETDRWLDTYVKNAEGRSNAVSQDGAGSGS